MPSTTVPLTATHAIIAGGRGAFADLDQAAPAHVTVFYYDVPAVRDVPTSWSDPGLPGEPAAIDIQRVVAADAIHFASDGITLDVAPGVDITRFLTASDWQALEVRLHDLLAEGQA